MNKINFIDKIMWINLDKSINRKEYMEKILKNIKIPNIRVSAIDGNNNNLDKIITIEKERELSSLQIAVTLSHIKAISLLNNIEGNYFMICEDDISFKNLDYFNKDDTLEKIIKESPNFDILMLYKTCINDIDNEYEDWMNAYNKGIHLYGAVCYIISRDGINKLNKIVNYIDDNNFKFLNDKIKFDFSEFFLFKNLNTKCYKYNYITTGDFISTINSAKSFQDTSNEFQLNIIKNKFKK